MTQVRAIDQEGLVPALEAMLGVGGRLVDLYVPGGDTTRLRCLLDAPADGLVVLEAALGEHRAYPALAPSTPAASWYERLLYDLHGLTPRGTPAPAPLVHLCGHCDRCRMLLATGAPEVSVLHYGPVRQGVTESIGYLIHSPGEEILKVEVGLGYKRREVEARFAHSPVAHGALLAERVEGQASVAWAIAYAVALEDLVGAEAPEAAWWWRILHAELERLVSHLDVLVALSEASALGVAAARFAYHKERVQQLRGRLCGSRFGRAVVVPGGVTEASAMTGSAALGRGDLRAELASLGADLAADQALLLRTASFVDRIRGAGPLPREIAVRHGATGVPARGSGQPIDARVRLAPYETLGFAGPRTQDGGDGLARTLVRLEELGDSVALIQTCCERLRDADGAPVYDRGIAEAASRAAGESVALVEAPQGEAALSLAVADGTIQWVSLRSGSFASLALLPILFVGDIFTDFAFNEAGLELSIAGAAR
jgi:formate hydrogenlyase subunit 5